MYLVDGLFYLSILEEVFIFIDDLLIKFWRRFGDETRVLKTNKDHQEIFHNHHLSFFGNL